MYNNNIYYQYNHLQHHHPTNMIMNNNNNGLINYDPISKTNFIQSNDNISNNIIIVPPICSSSPSSSSSSSPNSTNDDDISNNFPVNSDGSNVDCASPMPNKNGNVDSDKDLPYECVSAEEKIKQTKKKGPWTQSEDDLLRSLVAKFGARKWSVIALYVDGRIGKQCRERWMNHLDESLLKTSWTIEEDELLVKVQKMIGNRWSEMTKYFTGRSENSIKNRWYSVSKSTTRVPQKKTKPSESSLDDPILSASELVDTKSIGELVVLARSQPKRQRKSNSDSGDKELSASIISELRALRDSLNDPQNSAKTIKNDSAIQQNTIIESHQNLVNDYSTATLNQGPPSGWFVPKQTPPPLQHYPSFFANNNNFIPLIKGPQNRYPAQIVSPMAILPDIKRSNFPTNLPNMIYPYPNQTFGSYPMNNMIFPQ